MNIRDIGRMAETELENWCNQVGITPNRATYDKEGWDYFLQFPFETEASVPTLDQRPSRVECFVQVKGTDDSEKNRKSISLSNWERLIRNPLPAFFLIIDYSLKNQPVNAYLIHVDKKWIISVLHRLRELGSDDAQRLHKKTLDLTWTEDDKIEFLEGDGLKKAILAYIPEGMSIYIKQKQESQENVGDPTPALLEFTAVFATQEEFWNSLVDFAIGLRENIPISKFTLQEDIRFGIPASVKNETEGLLSITKQPVIDCTVTFINELNTLVSSFSAELHAPYWFFKGQEIPKEYFKQRVVFEIGETIIRPMNREATVNFNFLQAKPRRSLAEHANLWRVVLIINELSGFTIEITSKDNISLGSGKLNSPLDTILLDGELLELARMVDNAFFIARYFNFPTDKVIHLDQLLKQKEIFSELRMMCDINNQIRSVEGMIKTGAKLTQEVATPVVKRVVFDDLSLLVIIAVAGQGVVSDSKDNDWQKYIIEKPRRILERHVIVPNKDFSTKHVKKMLDDITEKLDAKGIDIIVAEEISRDVEDEQ